LSVRDSKYRRRATVALDAAGMVGLSTRFETQGAGNADGPHTHFEFIRHAIADQFIKPPLMALAALLERAEYYGRVICQLDVVGLGDLIRTSEDEGKQQPWVPFAGELTIPAGDSKQIGPELVGLARRWTYALARAYGLPEFESLQA